MFQPLSPDGPPFHRPRPFAALSRVFAPLDPTAGYSHVALSGFQRLS